MRMKRRQAAEQMARRAPVKMVFPLVFFFIPSLFIVIIGPIAINAWQGLTN
jgi:tight adherence protein C